MVIKIDLIKCSFIVAVMISFASVIFCADVDDKLDIKLVLLYEHKTGKDIFLTKENIELFEEIMSKVEKVEEPIDSENAKPLPIAYKISYCSYVSKHHTLVVDTVYISPEFVLLGFDNAQTTKIKHLVLGVVEVKGREHEVKPWSSRKCLLKPVESRE